jgi:hypothetical protein
MNVQQLIHPGDYSPRSLPEPARAGFRHRNEQPAKSFPLALGPLFQLPAGFLLISFNRIAGFSSGNPFESTRGSRQ